MHFEGRFDCKASKEEVWSFMMDPNSVGQCLPGIEKVEVLDEDNFNAKVRIGVAFIKGTFDFKVRMHDKKPLEHINLSAQGKGVASTIGVETSVDLLDLESGGTRMTWTAEAQVGGLISGIGPDMMNRAAEDMVNELFAAIRSKLETPVQGDHA